MTLLIISLIVMVAGLAALGYLIFKKLPDLKILDVESLAEERQGKAKKEILEAKFARMSGRFKSRFGKAAPQRSFLTEKIKGIKEKVLELEEKYKNSKAGETAPKTTAELFAEVRELIEKEEFAPAENILIEIIAKDNKNIEAYEMLGDLYFTMKSYDQAEEIYKHLLKLKLVGENGQRPVRGQKMEALEADTLATLDVEPQIAVYYEDLGQVYTAMGRDDQALEAYLKAVAVDPNNPKYLDKLLEMSIKVKDRGLARKTFNSLKKINPNNAKLPEWREAIEKM